MDSHVLTIKCSTKDRFLRYTGCKRNVISQDEGLNALMDTVDTLRSNKTDLESERDTLYTSYQELYAKFQALQEEHMALQEDHITLLKGGK